MTYPMPPTPDLRQDKPPLGARWKGTRRSVAGWALAILGLFASCAGLTGQYDATNGSPLPGGILFMAVGAGLVVWGRSLKARRIPVWPKPKPPKAPKPPKVHKVPMPKPPTVQKAPTPTPPKPRKAPKTKKSDRAARKTASSGRSAVWIMDISPQVREGWGMVDNGRLSLYVMDKHEAAIHKLVRERGEFVPSGRGGNGVLAAWADVVPQPSNRYDRDAVQVHVDGRPVAYFALEWKDLAHEHLKRAGKKPVRIPVVVRWWNQREYVWAFSSMIEAEQFAAWAARKDRE